MIVLTLQRCDYREPFPGGRAPPPPTTVVVDDETPSMVLCRRDGCFYAKCWPLPGHVNDATIHRQLKMSSEGVVTVLDTIRHKDWTISASYGETPLTA